MNNDWKAAHAFNLAQRTYSNRSLHGQVVHELGRRIVTGQIAEGTVLPNETELGASFEVSRTALREGIKVLAAKGLLASRTRTGTRVRPRAEWNMLDPDVLAWRMEAEDARDFLREMAEFRSAVEPLAASLAAKRATDAQIEEIEQAYESMEAAADNVQETEPPGLRFHQLILQASGNELLVPLNTMVETALRATFMQISPAAMVGLLPAHKDVLDAIKQHDASAAWRAMFRVLDQAAPHMDAVLERVGVGRYDA